MVVLTQGSCNLRNRSLDCSTLKAPVFALLHFFPPRLGEHVHLEEQWVDLTFLSSALCKKSYAVLLSLLQNRCQLSINVDMTLIYQQIMIRLG